MIVDHRNQSLKVAGGKTLMQLLVAVAALVFAAEPVEEEVVVMVGVVAEYLVLRNHPLHYNLLEVVVVAVVV